MSPYAFMFVDFQAQVMQVLSTIQVEVQDIRQRIEHNRMLLQKLQNGAVMCDTEDLELPGGVQLPMSSDDEIHIMEAALETGLFRKRLVS